MGGWGDAVGEVRRRRGRRGVGRSMMVGGERGEEGRRGLER